MLLSGASLLGFECVSEDSREEEDVEKLVQRRRRCVEVGADNAAAADRGQGQQSVSSHDEEEEALLDQLLSNSLPIPSVYPSSSSSADSNQQTSSSSDNTALGVVGMLRRLRLWTEEDARNGKLTILPRSITEWLRSTDK